MKSLYIISDSVGSGKSTYLREQVSADPNMYSGVITLVRDGKRFLYIIESGELIRLEYSPQIDKDEPLLEVGRYVFLESVFTMANEILMKSTERGNRIHILDEIGPLELMGKGFYNSLKHLCQLNNELRPFSVLVIRENLLHDVISFFNLSPYKILSLADLKETNLRSIIQES